MRSTETVNAWCLLAPASRCAAWQFAIAAMVTKDGGAAGGFAEKAEAAARCGVQLIVLRRPEEQGENAETILQRCRELL